MKMKEIVIRRRMWGRGTPGGSLRRVDTGKQCCLGFVCRALGVPRKVIADVAMPYGIADDYCARLPKWLLSSTHTSDVVKAANINDGRDITDVERERRITAIFKKHGLRAVFKP